MTTGFMSASPSPDASMADEPQEREMTVRERRAQHAREQARKDAPARLARKAIVPGIIILLIAAIATGFYFTNKSQGECPGHWHATFDVYVQDENGTFDRISFRDPQFDLSSGKTPLRAHMHQGDGKNQWHFEQGGQCVGVEEAFDYIDVELSTDRITFEGRHAGPILDQAGTYEETGNKTLRAFIESPSGEWREKSVRSILDYQLKDGEALLIVYGAPTDAQLQQFQDAVAVPDGRRTA